MKKDYVSPAVDVFEVRVNNVLCTSPNTEQVRMYSDEDQNAEEWGF